VFSPVFFRITASIIRLLLIFSAPRDDTARASCGNGAKSDFLSLETISIAMRDGVKLTADLYRDDAIAKAPVILTRTPYDRTKQKGTGEKWAKAGYVFIAQDCRGKFGSAGDFAPYNNEG
jgi:predicted acyl esterase